MMRGKSRTWKKKLFFFSKSFLGSPARCQTSGGQESGGNEEEEEEEGGADETHVGRWGRGGND